MIVALLLLLVIPSTSWAWELTDGCELRQETPKGTVRVAATAKAILLYPPQGLIANDTWMRVAIGNRNWRAPVVGGAVELTGAEKPFLEKNWMGLYADGKQVLGFNLYGASEAWEQLEACEPPARGGWVRLSGEITASSDDQIISAIRRQRPEGVRLDSAGGLAREAQRIGHAVREAGLATKVEANAQCLSECTFILAAGIPRAVASGGRVGIPASLITRGLGVPLSEQGSVEGAAAYFSNMGVNGGKTAVLATAGQHEGIRMFTQRELRELGFLGTSAPREAGSSTLRRFAGAMEGDW
jgi:hypothetical protein